MSAPHPDLAVFEQALRDHEAAVDLDEAGPVGVTPSASGITFLRSTTTTWVERERDNDVKVTVKHLARFAVRPKVIPDQAHRYGSKVFRPEWLEVTWTEGVVSRIHLTGPLVLKSGGTSQKAGSLETYWNAYDLTHPYRRTAYSTPLPEVVSRVVAEYELAVAVFTGAKR